MSQSVKRQVIFWPLVTAGVILDLATKAIVFKQVGYRNPPFKIIPGFIEFECHLNPGVAFGLGGGVPAWIHVLISGAICAFLVLLFYKGPSWSMPENTAPGAAHPPPGAEPGLPWGLWHDIAVGLILAGAVGNVYDRVVLGAVRDFIKVYIGGWLIQGGWWPTFNVADSCISVGVCVYLALTIIDMVVAGRAKRRTERAIPSPPRIGGEG